MTTPPCFTCGKQLSEQARSEFASFKSDFDIASNSFFLINICELCINDAAKKTDRVFHVDTRERPWKGTPKK